MQPFNKITSVAATLDLINIDTDMIIPKQFLKTIKRSGLGKNLFHEMRYDANNIEIADFILNQKDYKNSQILIAGSNFGCGSSREHAPWSLLDFGIRCIIAPSFADIFYNNCLKNAILPIILEENLVKELMIIASNKEQITVDLENNQILLTNKKAINFEIDKFAKECLIKGLDDIALTLDKEESISNFESENKQNLPWVYN
jgi:3-isopropylmalate/(R)-2-methylmalate dehydratase small subunit